MSAKRALIVDDSKSARAFLSRILEKYEIDVETAESAEQAIEHLATHRPDVIFMDHLMPGMDGFQAVQLIKNNPRTATIPIMMYTSQEGELYLGQARALGAVGVLPKQIRPADVSKVLYQLKLVPDRRSGEQSSFQSLEAEAANAAVAFGPQGGAPPEAAHSAAGAMDGGTGLPHGPRADAPASPAQIGAELRQFVDTAVHAQMVELRQFLTMSLEDQAARTINEVRTLLQDLPRPRVIPAAPSSSPWPWMLACASLAAAIAFGVLWSREIVARQTAESRFAQRPATPAVASGVADSTLPEPQPALPEPAPGAAVAPQASQAVVAGVEAAAQVPAGATAAPPPDASRATSAAPPAASPAAPPAPPPPVAAALPGVITETVPYGEIPLAGARIEALRSAFTRAIGQGFRGTAEVRTFAARYCLVGNAGEGYSLAPEDLPLSKCDLLGNPHDEAQPASQGESLDFANLVGSLRQSAANGFEVRVLSGDAGSVAVPYPPAGEKTTAGEWNRAAVANNRIEVRLRPAR